MASLVATYPLLWPNGRSITSVSGNLPLESDKYENPTSAIPFTTPSYIPGAFISVPPGKKVNFTLPFVLFSTSF